jgi:hypothetical protein
MAGLEGVKFCEVTWHDAHAESSWQQVRDIDADPYVVKTAGWLLQGVKEGHVVIAQSIGADDAIDGVLCIPVGMVVGIRLIGA